MSSDAEDLFFDAESDVSLRNSKMESEGAESTDDSDDNHGLLPVKEEPKTTKGDAKGNDPELNKTRQQLEGLRSRLLNREEEEEEVQSPDSPVSSVEGVYAANKPIKFKVVEHDTVSMHSMMSLGRIGMLLGAANPDTMSLKEVKAPLYIKNAPLACRSTAASRENITREIMTRSKSVSDLKTPPDKPDSVPVECPTESPAGVVSPEPPKLNFTEPDIVASTKSPLPGEAEMKEPIAPPRRKRKGKNSRCVSQESLQSAGENVLPPPSEEGLVPSPGTAIEALTKEFEKSLSQQPEVSIEEPKDAPSFVLESADMDQEGQSKQLDVHAAKRGLYMVKPQDEPLSKAVGSPSSSEGDDQVDAFLLTPPGCSGTSEREGVVDQTAQGLRVRSNSGKPLTEKEILDQLTVLNLDTGERVPLSEAEDKIPKCVNPLSLHIMRLTSEYVSHAAADKQRDSDEESVDIRKPGSDHGGDDGDTISLRKKTMKFGRVIGSTVRKTIGKAKRVANTKLKEEPAMDLPDEANVGDQYCKMKASSSHKGPYEFDTVKCIQDLSGEHAGPVWCMKFSHCGRLLATAGQDKVLRIWVLKSAFHYFLDMRTRYNADNKVSPTPSSESLKSQHSGEDFRCHSRTLSLCQDQEAVQADPTAPFMPKPFCVYSGHTADVLDLSWSKNYFVLSSSMDKTVRLWHISRKECLCCFQHIDFVTAIAFHPKDDRYFLSGSLDGKLRLWHIPDKKVALWNELDGQTKLITAAGFCQNGNFAVVGSYDGRCIFYTTEQLKYHTQIHVRSTRGKNSKGRKITGIEALPGEDKILVTSNDSRLRLYDLRDCSPSCKYKGCVNTSSQIRASFSHDGKYIICGSENQCIYMWKTHHDYAKFSSARRDRNNFWEAIRAHNAVVTSAVFAPEPQMVIDYVEHERRPKEAPDRIEQPTMQRSGSQSTVRLNGTCNTIPHAGWTGYVIVSADYNGSIKVFMNKTKPKHSSLPASALT